jgi:hypothetical protein
MTLENFANLAEVIGVVAVLASLIFVGVQIRQNTVQAKDANRLARAQMHQQIADGFTQVMSFMTQVDNKVIEDLFLDGDPKALSRADLQRFTATMMGLWKHLENVFYQQKEGFVSEAYWQSTCNYISLMIMRPGARWWWEERKAVFASEFVEFVDALESRHIFNELHGMDDQTPPQTDTEEPNT